MFHIVDIIMLTPDKLLGYPFAAFADSSMVPYGLCSKRRKKIAFDYFAVRAFHPAVMEHEFFRMAFVLQGLKPFNSVPGNISTVHYKFQRLVPGDSLPFPLTSFTHSQHWMEDPVRIIYLINARLSLCTYFATVTY